MKKYPTRFVGLGTLPMQNAALAVQELKRCKYELGMVPASILLESISDRYRPDRVEPITAQYRFN